jgi:hypothetical protein
LPSLEHFFQPFAPAHEAKLFFERKSVLTGKSL